MSDEPRLRIIATCSLCGHELPSWWDKEAMDAHLAEAHGLRFDPQGFTQPTDRKPG